LFARDNGINGNVTRVDLHIYVERINQHAPQFDADYYVFHVDENSIKNTTVGFIKAFDLDTTDEYARIHYELKNGQDR
jgi:hypothetical protein